MKKNIIKIFFIVIIFFVATNSYANNIVYIDMDYILNQSIKGKNISQILENENKTKTDGIKIFKKGIENVSPSVEVKSRRIGGATYQVPIEVPRNRAFYLAALWIINSSNNSSGKPMSEKLASELIAAANGDGGAIKKKEDMHRMADANKAFAHFR